MDVKIDWNEVWKERMEAQRKASLNTDCASIWHKKENARRFWEMSRENGVRIEKTLGGMALTSESRVLDIGAGPGSLAIPIAERVAHVTAVEPAEGMMSVLTENIETYGLKNIDCVYKDWEVVDVDSDLCPPYDVVFASYSLGMKDISASIRKMVEASSGYIYLYWFAGETSWDMHSRKLWPFLHNCEYQSGPKVDVLYNVLYDMGIYPNVTVFPFEHTNRFGSLEEAVEHFRSHYAVESEVQEEILRAYLDELLEEEGGTFVHRGWSTRVKMWWKNIT
ncbi:class I SAM-dependent methyltransferase [Methanosarcina sp. KYL-1]|uniref:class I SAM-dependent methyltransferase n=1 Tax=Methanosarcina sp. KYL-1 TaxID=2602068 RepID=UPI0021013A4C|nr:class I SAM-dependent methyltransferase [Methanosarcina sp. KYL-1]MCQ1534251.1 class I SAM-dependent methyltransferase [Methanosarcina sp. KYL-1]